MNIEITSTGKQFYEVPDVVAALLMEAFPEAFKRIVPKSAAPEAVAVQFSIQREIGSRLVYIRVFCPKCQKTDVIGNPAMVFRPGTGNMLDERFRSKSPAAWAKEVAHSLDGKLCIHAGGAGSRVPEHVVKAFVVEFENK